MLKRPRWDRDADGWMLLPAAWGTAGIGALSAQAPALGMGVGGVGLLTLMPWDLLFLLMSAAAIFSKFRLDVAGMSIQLAHIALIPLAIRVFLLDRERPRRWRLPELALIAFVSLQVVTSYLNAENRTQSLLAAGLLLFGVLGYLCAFGSVVTRRRLIFAGRAVLIAAMASAVVAEAAIAAHYLLGTGFGVVAGEKFAGIPVPFGLTKEHNILGSMSASAAIGFLILSREANPLFSRRFCNIGFWVCLAAMVASLTRSAWIGFGLVLLVTLVWRRRRQSHGGRVAQSSLAFLAVVVVATGIFALQASDSPVGTAVVERGTELLNFESGSGEARLEEWTLAGRDIRGSLLIGLGTNSYGQRHIAPRKSVDVPLEERGAYLGNLYLRTLYDSGVLGLLLLLIALGTILWPGRLLRTSSGDLAPVAWAFVFMYVTLALAYVGTDASFQVWPWIVLALARAAVSFALTQHRTLLRPAGEGNGQSAPPVARAGRERVPLF